MAMELFHRVLGSGDPIIILHGIFGSSDNWMTIAKKLSQRYKLYLPDLRNHGNSFHHPDFNYKIMVNDMVSFIETHNISNPLIVGHSMGGKLAMNLALHLGPDIRKLMVIDIGPQFYPIHHERILNGLRDIKLDDFHARKDIDEALSGVIPEFAERQFILKNLKRMEDGSFAWKLNVESLSRNIGNVGEEIEGESKFTNPTLFVKGEHSHYLDKNNLDGITKFFPNATITEVLGAGHWVHADKPEAFLKVLQDFINQ